MWTAPSTPITVVHSNFGHIMIILVNADFTRLILLLSPQQYNICLKLRIRDWCFLDEHEILWIGDIVPILYRIINIKSILYVFLLLQY